MRILTSDIPLGWKGVGACISLLNLLLASTLQSRHPKPDGARNNLYRNAEPSPLA